MMWWPGGNGWGSWIAMLISMAIFWGGLAFLIAWAVGRSNPGARRERADPKTILEERFARGEITKEELEDGRRVLEGRA